MRGSSGSAQPNHVWLRQVTVDGRPDEMHFQTELRGSSTSLLRDHLIFQIPVLPAAAYLDAAFAAAEQLTGQSATAMANVVFHDLLALPAEDARLLRIRVRRTARGTTRFDVESASASEASVSTWRRHAEGIVEHEPQQIGDSSPGRAERDSHEDPAAERMSGEEFYAQADRGPFQWGVTHRVVRSVCRVSEGVVAELSMAEDSGAADSGCRLHPTLLDGCLQVLAMEISGDGSEQRAAIPYRIDRVRLTAASPRRVSVHWQAPGGQCEPKDSVRVDISVYDETGRRVGALEGVRFRSISRDVLESAVARHRSQPGARQADAKEAASGGRGRTTALLARLESAPSSNRCALLAAFIEQNVIELLKVKSPTASDLQRGFFSIGLDSLLAIELQFRLQTALGFSLPPSEGLKFETIEELSRYLLEDVLSLDVRGCAETP
jgi:acyl transferase domain-containing protein